jgi:hypothetical protein
LGRPAAFVVGRWGSSNVEADVPVVRGSAFSGLIDVI